MRNIGLALAALLAAGAAIGTAHANILVTVDKSTQRMNVQVDGVTRWNWRVSTGAAGYDTPSGTWHAFRMEASHFSKEFDDAPMPHSIFFTKRGHAIHGYLNTSHLGLPVSHGCVRLDPQNAAALYALVKQDGVLNTTVVITGHIPDAAVARRRGPGDQVDQAADTPQYQPQYQQPYQPQYQAPQQYSQPSYRAPYSGDDRFMSSPTYGGPPQPPPGYPPFPRSY